MKRELAPAVPCATQTWKELPWFQDGRQGVTRLPCLGSGAQDANELLGKLSLPRQLRKSRAIFFFAPSRLRC